MRTWIKVCGTTTVEDALASVEAGADALGFIFAPSPRQVSIARTREITRELPPHIERIGVFLNSPTEEIQAAISQVELTGIQMHGEESATNICLQLPEARRDSLRKIKTVLVRDGFALRIEADSKFVDAWLLDSGAGSGKVFDWKSAAEMLTGRKARFIIAGGLTPENVSRAIQEFHPWGVDVVTGVEHCPGRKDRDKLKSFVAAVRKAENEEACAAQQR